MSKWLSAQLVKLINWGQRYFISEMTREEFQEFQDMKKEAKKRIDR